MSKSRRLRTARVVVRTSSAERLSFIVSSMTVRGRLMRVDEYVATNLANWNSRVPHHELGYGLDAFRDDPAHLSGGGALRPAPPRRRRRARRRPPAVPHRHRHAVARPARGTDDRPRLLRPGARRRPPAGRRHRRDDRLRRGRAVRRGERARRRALRPRLHRHRRAVLAAVDHALGGRSSPPCCARAGGCSSARAIRCCGRWTTRATTGCSSSSYPYFEVAGGTALHTSRRRYVDHDEPLAAPDTIQFNHGLGEIVTALLDAGMRVDDARSSTTRCRGTRWAR